MKTWKNYLIKNYKCLDKQETNTKNFLKNWKLIKIKNLNTLNLLFIQFFNLVPENLNATTPNIINPTM